MMNLWISLPASIRGFIRSLGIVVIFAALDFVAKNIGALGLSPYIATFVTAIIASIENHQTSVAQARVQ